MLHLSSSLPAGSIGDQFIVSRLDAINQFQIDACTPPHQEGSRFYWYSLASKAYMGRVVSDSEAATELKNQLFTQLCYKGMEEIENICAKYTDTLPDNIRKEKR
ncbi:unnamed protein product [Caretta caretta]